MKKVTEWIDHALRANTTSISLEILPPSRGNGILSVYEHLEQLIDLNPVFINVTYHRREVHVVKTPDGSTLIKESSRRPGTIGISSAIQQRFGVSTVMHLICGGFTREETEDALLELSYLGVKNVLALRGDGLKKDDKKFIPTPGGHSYAMDLVHQISNLNRGVYVDETFQGERTDFCIGVAGYPEKHFEAASMEEDILYLKAKVDAGAEYVITQMFFDNAYYFKYVDACRAMGINVPIIPGLKPITTKRHLRTLPDLFYTDIPEELRRAVEQADDKHVPQVGSEWLAYQIEELKRHHVPIIHFYTVGSVAKPIRSAVQRTF